MNKQEDLTKTMRTSNTFMSKGVILFSCIVSALMISRSVYAKEAVTVVNLPYAENHLDTSPPYYYEEVLRLSLQKTESKFGKFKIVFYPFPVGRERQRAIVKNNLGLDVIWSSSTPAREEQLLAIKFNLLKEINGYKILLIRAEDQEKFSSIKSIVDLRKFKAGTGTHWRDTQVLSKNDIPFVTSWDYEPMFKMLAVKRFDYIVRGTQEIWNEITLHQDLHLAAEQTLLIKYNQPVYFFVNPKNIELAARIKLGLEIAEKDGSLEKLFLRIPGFQKAREEIHNKQRRVITFIDAD